MKRKRTDFIVVHCSATPPEMDIGVKEIKKWHTDPKPVGRGWADIGYACVIRRDGTREMGRNLDAHTDDFDEVGAHVGGYNSVSVGICMVGGVDVAGKKGKPQDNFTKAQYDALWEVIQILKMHYPKAEVVGHRDLNAGKDCPSFDVKRFYAEKLKEND